MRRQDLSPTVGFWRAILALCGFLFCGAASAHSFGQSYTLPIPVGLYQAAAVAALFLSFVITGFIRRAPSVSEGRFLNLQQPFERFRALCLPLLLRLLMTGLLVLSIATGLLGNQGVYRNLNMTLFWIVFLLGASYCCALLGNIQRFINPWSCLIGLVSAISPQYAAGRFRYPEKLAYWPAVVLFIGLIWFELFGESSPHSLALLLAAYSLLTVAAVGLFGQQSWFRYCEIFHIFFGLLARVSVFRWDRRAGGLYLRIPMQGLVTQRKVAFSLLVFMLAMLAATAFDGLHETQAWHRLYWVDLYRGYLQSLYGDNPFVAFASMRNLYGYWQAGWLVLFPFLYVLVFLACISLVRLAGGIRMPLTHVAAQFAPSLLPIVLVYHVAHYYTLLQTQGVKIISLASDPFGWGWNLFGTADWLRYSIVPDLGTVWHTQVALIVIGHVASVYAAHWQALIICQTPRRALLSQLPMLLLMMLFTASGLWILAQPLQA